MYLQCIVSLAIHVIISGVQRLAVKFFFQKLVDITFESMSSPTIAAALMNREA